MIAYESLKTKPQVLSDFTGLTLKAFQNLLTAFAQAYEDDLDRRDAERVSKRERQRGADG